MKCLKCKEGKLLPIKKDGVNYAQCDKCGILFSVDDLRNYATQKMQNSQPEESEKKKGSCLKTGMIIAGLFLTVFIVVGAIAIFSGDKNSTDTADEAINQKTKSTESAESESETEIDIEQCISDLKDNLSLEPDYTFVRDYYIKADESDLTISIVVDDATDPEAALDFADTVVRQLNLYANMQDSSIEPGNADYYGGLYKKFSALVGVAPLSQTDNTDAYFVYDAIVGGKTKLKLSKKYLSETQPESASTTDNSMAQDNFNTYNNPEQQQTTSNYVLNTNPDSMKFHYPSCDDVSRIAPQNYATFDGTRDDVLNQGYSPCGHCDP